jgi:hypothetical protein
MIIGAVIILLGTLLCGGCGGCYYGLGDRTYSEGHRDGHVFKFSHKGFFHKSWEGEMAMPGFRSTGGEAPAVTNIWAFSVEDNATDPNLRDGQGNPRRIVDILSELDARTPVRLHYRQIWVNSPGLSYSTDYRITRVEILPTEPKE